MSSSATHRTPQMDWPCNPHVQHGGTPALSHQSCTPVAHFEMTSSSLRRHLISEMSAHRRRDGSDHMVSRHGSQRHQCSSLCASDPQHPRSETRGRPTTPSPMHIWKDGPVPCDHEAAAPCAYSGGLGQRQEWQPTCRFRLAYVDSASSQS